MKLSSCIPILIVIFSILTHSVSASVDYTEIYDWVKNEPKSDAPTAGTILTSDGIEVLNKWIPPGMIEEFKFPELNLVIQETKVEKPHASYISATEKWANTASINTDGSLINYTAGQPFSDEQIKNVTNDLMTKHGLDPSKQIPS